MKKFYVMGLSDKGLVYSFQDYDGRAGSMPVDQFDDRDEAQEYADRMARTGRTVVILTPLATVTVATETKTVTL